MKIKEWFQVMGGFGVLALFALVIAFVWVEDTKTVFKLICSDIILMIFCYLGEKAQD